MTISDMEDISKLACSGDAFSMGGTNSIYLYNLVASYLKLGQ
jgi:hypothetical protein